MLQPDGFVILKIQLKDETIYKLFSSFNGGYLDSDKWRINSGIVEISEDEEWNGCGSYYFIKSYSETIYHVHDSKFNKLNSFAQNVLSGVIQQNLQTRIEIIDIEQYLNENNI